MIMKITTAPLLPLLLILGLSNCSSTDPMTIDHTMKDLGDWNLIFEENFDQGIGA